MRILLPPSEAKNPGGRGRPLNRRATPLDQAQPLDQARQATLQALARLIEDPAGAAEALLLPDSVAGSALAQNAAVLSSATMPAIRRYAGVVYSGLAVDALSVPAQRLAGRELLIFSGLFGVLRGADGVPNYRVPAKAVLPGLGVASTYWRPILTGLLPAMLGRAGLIVDLRSSDYASMWQPAPASPQARRLVTVRVLSRRPNGSYGVISYASKLAKGRLAGQLLERSAAHEPARTVEAVAETWIGLGGRDAQPGPARLGCLLELIE
ncbi:MAG: peroxide stress protein YaaA [Jatrophihabitantaceae bacterium]